MRKKFLFAFIIVVLVTCAVVFSRQSRPRVKGARTDKKVVHGVIVPHHDLAKEILVDSYERLKDEEYNLIVVIGPNHFYPDFREAVTCDSESGINIPESLSRKIIKDINAIKEDNQVIEGEHSIGVQTKYIDEYFPEAEVLPIVVPPNFNEEDIESLVNILSDSSKKTLFIGSVDFAHNMTYLEALENNKESINAIMSFYYETINSFDDQHMDSPKSIVLLLKIMQKLQATNFHVLHDTHGALLIDDPLLQGTSYVAGFFEN